MSYLKKYGQRLIELGYDIVPIKPGTKKPAIKDWTQLHVDEAMLTRWLGNGLAQSGVGVQTRFLPAVDIDVRDETVVNEMIEYCESLAGKTLIRVGEAPKSLLVYRAEESFTKITSAKYADWLDNTCQVEILGDGQQFVAFADHPVTSEAFEWFGGDIASVGIKDLPVLTEDNARLIVAKFEEIAEREGMTKKTRSKINRASTNAMKKSGNDNQETCALDYLTPKFTISNEKIKLVLSHIASSDYDDWMTVGMALWHQFDGDIEGFELWDEWSREASNYDPGVMHKHWDSFDHTDKNHKPVSFASVMEMAQSNGFDWGKGQEKKTALYTIDDFMTQYVYVVDGNRVCDLKMPPHHSVMKHEEFVKNTANIRHEVPDPTQKEPERTKMAPMSSAWLVRTDRKTVRGTDYHPTKDRIIKRDKLAFINTYYSPNWGLELAVRASDQDIQPYIDHMFFLIPDDFERNWFIAWCAKIIQRPHERHRVVPLHVSEQHGTGRGWVVQLMETLLGDWNCSRTTLPNLVGKGSKGQWDDYMHEKLFCSIGEVKEEGKRQFEINDTVRDKLDAKRLPMNLKFGRSGTFEVYTSNFWMSNHVNNALVIPNEDRRICVLSGPDTYRPDSYYQKMYNWLENYEAMRKVYWFLRGLDISKYSFSRAPMTPGKQRMIDNGLSDTERLFHDLMSNCPVLMTREEVETRMYALSDRPAMDTDISRKQLDFLLSKFCQRHKQIQEAGARWTLWQMNKNKKLEIKELRAWVRGKG